MYRVAKKCPVSRRRNKFLRICTGYTCVYGLLVTWRKSGGHAVRTAGSLVKIKSQGAMTRSSIVQTPLASRSYEIKDDAGWGQLGRRSTWKFHIEHMNDERMRA
jgi:hypothetical protein